MKQLAKRLVEAGLPIFVPKNLETKEHVTELLDAYHSARERLKSGRSDSLCGAFSTVLHNRCAILQSPLYIYFLKGFATEYATLRFEGYIARHRELNNIVRAWAQVTDLPQGTEHTRDTILERFQTYNLGDEWHRDFRLTLLDIMERRAREHYATPDRSCGGEMFQIVQQLFSMTAFTPSARALLEKQLEEKLSSTQNQCGQNGEVIPSPSANPTVPLKTDEEIVETVVKDQQGKLICKLKSETYSVLRRCVHCNCTVNLTFPKGTLSGRANWECPNCGCTRT